jgi:hypothetical protein
MAPENPVSSRKEDFSSQWKQYKQCLQQSCVSSASFDSEHANKKLIKEGQMRAAEMSHDDVEQATPEARTRVRQMLGSAANSAVITSNSKPKSKLEPVSATSVHNGADGEEDYKKGHSSPDKEGPLQDSAKTSKVLAKAMP